MEINDATFVPKYGYFFTHLGQSLSQKIGLFPTFSLNLTNCLFIQNVGSLKQEVHLCPCFWHF